MKKALSAILAACLLFAALCLPANAAGGFHDVPSGIWYEKAVNFCAENGYMSGKGNNSFDPGGKVTRAQMAQILYNFSKAPDVSGLENPFSDVGNVWYKQAVVFAKAAGVVNGTSATTYSPAKDITREEVTVMLMGYYTKSTGNKASASPSALDSFSDKDRVSSWAKSAITWAVENKIISGSDGKLDPKGTCIRAQLAQFIMNYCTACGNPAVIEIGGAEVPTPSPSPGPSPSPSGNSGNYYHQVAHPENADKTDWLETYQFTDLSGPWDNCQAVTELPIGGYRIGEHRYNKYGAPLDGTDGVTEPVDGIPTDDEKKAIILINQHRLNNGLQPLIWDQAAQVIAETRAIEGGGFHGKVGINDGQGGGHKRPNGDDKNNYETGIVVEWANIGILKNHSFNPFCWENAVLGAREYWENDYGYHEGYGPAQIVKGWIESKGHDAALKTPNHQYGAVAASHYENEIDNVGNKYYHWYYDSLEIY